MYFISVQWLQYLISHQTINTQLLFIQKTTEKDRKRKIKRKRKKRTKTTKQQQIEQPADKKCNFNKKKKSIRTEKHKFGFQDSNFSCLPLQTTEMWDEPFVCRTSKSELGTPGLQSKVSVDWLPSLLPTSVTRFVIDRLQNRDQQHVYVIQRPCNSLMSLVMKPGSTFLKTKEMELTRREQW